MKENPFSLYNSKYGQKKGDMLSWEESINGSSDEPEDYYEGHSSGSNSAFFRAILFLIFVILGVRLVYLQVVQSDYYSALAFGNHVRVQDVLAPRGVIYDSHRQVLAQNIASFELMATPVDLPKEGLEQLVEKLATIVPLDREEALKTIREKGKNTFSGVSIIQSVPREAALAFEARAEEFPGFSIQNNPIRDYKDALIFSHVLGYTGKINDQELDEHKDNDKYILNDYIGKTGIEYSYERNLKGINGKKQLEVDARGVVKSSLGEIAPVAGSSLVLNIDAELQKEIYQEIVKRNPGKKAAAVAVHPQTGQVLALVSIPGFDNNLFAQGIKSSEYSALLNDPKKPLLNRVVSGTYPPGSTIKPVIAAAALQEGVVDENTTIFDNGDLVYGGYHFRGWKRDGLGKMNVRSAIAWSSDIYFYTVGGGQQALGIDGLGPERLTKYYSLFGMGKKLGIDTPSEATGIVASPSWRKEYFKTAELQKWYPGYTYHISIGQGDMITTPLQVTMWIATVANGGTLYKPYIVDAVLNDQGQVAIKNKPEVIRSDFVDAKNIEIVRQGMRETVVSGTARSLNTLPITAAGKTGTAQFDGADLARTHAWFTAFAPYEDPQIAITVLVEDGGEGSTSSSPVVKAVLQWWAENRHNQK